MLYKSNFAGGGIGPSKAAPLTDEDLQDNWSGPGITNEDLAEEDSVDPRWNNTDLYEALAEIEAADAAKREAEEAAARAEQEAEEARIEAELAEIDAQNAAEDAREAALALLSMSKEVGQGRKYKLKRTNKIRRRSSKTRRRSGKTKRRYSKVKQTRKSK